MVRIVAGAVVVAVITLGLRLWERHEALKAARMAQAALDDHRARRGGRRGRSDR